MNNPLLSRRLPSLPDRSPDASRDTPLHPPKVSRLDGAMHYDVAMAYEALELPDDAIYELELAAEDPAWTFPSWRSVGRLHHASRRWDDARRAYERALAVVDEADPSARGVQEHLALAREHTPLPSAIASGPAKSKDDGELQAERDVDQAFDDLFS